MGEAISKKFVVVVLVVAVEVVVVVVVVVVVAVVVIEKQFNLILRYYIDISRTPNK